VQLDRTWKNTFNGQPGVNTAHHDFGHLVEKLPDVFLALAGDGHFVHKQQFREGDFVVDKILVQILRVFEGILGLPLIG
jgi:hypothetical protein